MLTPHPILSVQSLKLYVLCIRKFTHKNSRETERDSKGFEICTAVLEFESGRAPLVRAWDSRDFTPSPGPTKCVFQGMRFPRIKKKKKSLPIKSNYH